MPELPEVECFARMLHATCAGKTCLKIQLHRPNLRYQFDQGALSAIFATGAKIISISRRHKQLVILTSGGEVYVSLGMSGSFVFREVETSPLPHEHVTLAIQSSKLLCYVDPRRFGYWQVMPNSKPNLQIADPLVSKELHTAFQNSKHRATPIKSLLMDQNIIGGLGNIYVLEALFLARISPARSCNSLKQSEWKVLASCIPKLLQKAIETGGSSIATYKNLYGNKGGFQDLHHVYGRCGQSCSNCQAPIVKIIQSGRSSFYCQGCQK